MTNVLLLIPELGPGGAERAISRLSVELSKNHNIYLCRFTPNDAVVYPYGGTLVSLQPRNTNNLFLKMYAFIVRILELRDLKKRYQIEWSISFLEGANYINVLSKRKDKTCISLRGSIYHDKDITGLVGFIRKRLLVPVIYKRADKVVALSAGLREELVQNVRIAPQKVQIIYNHYDVEELTQKARQPVPESFKKILIKPVLTTSGRLHQAKGHRELLKAFAELHKTTECRLVIFGDGDLLNELVQLTLSLGMKGYDFRSKVDFTIEYDVYFMGYVNDPFNFMAASTVFVFPSHYEGLGNSLVEALACSVPIVASDCLSGPREVLAPGTQTNYNLDHPEFGEYGILMPIFNTKLASETWVKVLRDLISNRVMREQYATKSIRRLRDFNTKSILVQWNDLLKSQNEVK